MFDLQGPNTQAILLSHNNLTDVEVRPIVRRADRLVLYVRAPTGDYALKAASTPAVIQQEVCNNQKLAAAGLPVAQIVATDDVPVPHVLQTWIAGDALHTGCSPAVINEAAAMLRRIHDLGGGPPYAGNSSWDAWMRGWLHHALPWWQQTAGIPEARIRNTWQTFEQLQPLLATRGKGYILFDGRPEHFIVADNRIAGLIDLGEARSGDPAMDLGVLGANNPALLNKILSHYKAPATEWDHLNVLTPFYTFLRLLALASWHIEQNETALASALLARVDTHPWPARQT